MKLDAVAAKETVSPMRGFAGEGGASVTLGVAVVEAAATWALPVVEVAQASN